MYACWLENVNFITHMSLERFTQLNFKVEYFTLMSEFPYSIDIFGISVTNMFILITYFVSNHGLILSHDKYTLKMVLFDMSITIMRTGKVPFSKLASNSHAFPIKVSVLQQRFS